MNRKRNKRSNASPRTYFKSRLTPDHLADCATFARMFHARKAETKAAKDEPTWTRAYLEERTGISQNSWGDYIRGDRPMTPKAMVCIENLYGYPKENFRCWPRAQGAAPAKQSPAAIAAAIAELPAIERVALTETLRLLLNAPRGRRAKVIETMRRMLRASGKISLVKASSG